MVLRNAGSAAAVTCLIEKCLPARCGLDIPRWHPADRRPLDQLCPAGPVAWHSYQMPPSDHAFGQSGMPIPTMLALLGEIHMRDCGGCQRWLAAIQGQDGDKTLGCKGAFRPVQVGPPHWPERRSKADPAP
jgi:hypothetical protein